MALIYIPADHIKLRKSISFDKKPILMLKDYLRDDLSSCSSSGFKSFPRRQCCTTVRFLLEADLKKSKGNYSSGTKRLLKRSRSKPVSTTFAALQRASEAVLNAVKLLPFASVKSSSPLLQTNSSRKGLLPRSFSRKLFKRSLWRKSEKDGGEIKHLKLFREFLEEKNQPSDENNITNVNTTDSRVQLQSEFTSDVLQSSSGNSESSSENDVVEGKTTSLENKNVSNIVGATVGEDPVSYTKNWQNEGKEQFSPVSVLDCPFDDEDDNSSPNNFQDQLARVEGTKQKLMQKIRRFDFENLQAELEPVDLEKRIALSELKHESLCRLSINNNANLSAEEQQKLISETKLLKLFKTKIPSECITFKADNLLLDFFKEQMEEDNARVFAYNGLKEFDPDLILNVAEDWINGNPRELLVGWESQEGRRMYVKEMERNQNWRNFDEEKEEVGMQIELDVFSLLVDEILIDLF